jgi:ketosteroid isomerase-like protein
VGTQENKEIARKYHDLKPEDVDRILAPNFVGRHRSKPGGGYTHTWDRESHRKYLSEYLGKQKDTIHEMIAEGDWVATRGTRRMVWKGREISTDAMQFKRFANGKIVEIWEYFDSRQLDEEAK